MIGEGGGAEAIGGTEVEEEEKEEDEGEALMGDDVGLDSIGTG